MLPEDRGAGKGVQEGAKEMSAKEAAELIEEERKDLGDYETVSELLKNLDKIDREEGPVGMPPYLKRILAAYRREQK